MSALQGPPPEPVNPGNPGRGPAIMGITWTFTGLTIVAMALRFHVRKKGSQGLSWWDDWLMALAVVFQIVCQALISVSYSYGLGMHDLDQTQEQMIEMRKWRWISIPAGMGASIFARISIAILLIRLFGIRKWFYWTIIAIASLSSVIGFLTIPLNFMQYDPIDGLWDPMVQKQAKNRYPELVVPLEYLATALFAFSDLVFVLLPVIIIWRLNLKTHRKIGLIVLMCFSLFAMVMAVFKVVWIDITLSWYDGMPEDMNYNAALLVLWGSMEQCIVILMGCVPPLRGLVQLGIPGWSFIASSLGSGSRRRSRATGSSSREKSSGESSSDRTTLDGTTRNLGRFGAHRTVPSNTIEHTRRGSSEDELIGTNKVRQTTSFAVSYQEASRSEKGQAEYV